MSKIKIFVLLKTKKHPNNLDPKTQAKETNSIFSLEFPVKKKKNIVGYLDTNLSIFNLVM